MKIAILTILAALSLQKKDIENAYPEIDKPIPEFTLTEVGGYPRKEIAASDLRGQFYILDFWSQGCAACVASFPKLNKLHSLFKGQVSIFLVGTEEKGIKLAFDKFKAKLDLTFPYAFGDLWRRFVPGGVPHLIWVDDEGIVKAITSGSDLNEDNIRAFLSKKKFDFYNTSYSAKQIENNYDIEKPFLVDGNGGKDTDFLFRSVLAEYKPPMPFKHFPYPYISDYKKENWLEGTGGLMLLYRMAYSGRPWIVYGDPIYESFYNSLVLDIKDSSMFKTNQTTGKGIYWYSQIVPLSKATPEYMMEVMQRDLQDYFGYDVKVEIRKMPYWSLKASKDGMKKLKTKGGDKTDKSTPTSINSTNISIKNLMEYLFSSISPYHPPFLDETGIDYNIDVNMEVITSSVEDIKRSLRSIGLDIEKAEKEFRVIVISDRTLKK